MERRQRKGWSQDQRVEDHRSLRRGSINEIVSWSKIVVAEPETEQVVGPPQRWTFKRRDKQKLVMRNRLPVDLPLVRPVVYSVSPVKTQIIPLADDKGFDLPELELMPSLGSIDLGNQEEDDPTVVVSKLKEEVVDLKQRLQSFLEASSTSQDDAVVKPDITELTTAISELSTLVLEHQSSQNTEWSIHHDAATGTPYYYNHTTQRTTWNDPSGSEDGSTKEELQARQANAMEEFSLLEQRLTSESMRSGFEKRRLHDELSLQVKRLQESRRLRKEMEKKRQLEEKELAAFRTKLEQEAEEKRKRAELEQDLERRRLEEQKCIQSLENQIAANDKTRRERQDLEFQLKLQQEREEEHLSVLRREIEKYEAKNETTRREVLRRRTRMEEMESNHKILLDEFERKDQELKIEARTLREISSKPKYIWPKWSRIWVDDNWLYIHNYKAYQTTKAPANVTFDTDKTAQSPFLNIVIILQNLFRRKKATRFVLEKRLSEKDIGATWTEEFDPDSECVFYYNARTRQSVWELPEGAVLVEKQEGECSPKPKNGELEEEGSYEEEEGVTEASGHVPGSEVESGETTLDAKGEDSGSFDAPAHGEKSTEGSGELLAERSEVQQQPEKVWQQEGASVNEKPSGTDITQEEQSGEFRVDEIYQEETLESVSKEINGYDGSASFVAHDGSFSHQATSPTENSMDVFKVSIDDESQVLGSSSKIGGEGELGTFSGMCNDLTGESTVDFYEAETRQDAPTKLDVTTQQKREEIENTVEPSLAEEERNPLDGSTEEDIDSHFVHIDAEPSHVADPFAAFMGDDLDEESDHGINLEDMDGMNWSLSMDEDSADDSEQEDNQEGEAKDGENQPTILARRGSKKKLAISISVDDAEDEEAGVLSDESCDVQIWGALQARATPTGRSAGEWVEKVDVNSGEIYYVNLGNGEATWEMPADFARRTGSIKPKETLMSWELVVGSKNEHLFWINWGSGESQLEKPLLEENEDAEDEEDSLDSLVVVSLPEHTEAEQATLQLQRLWEVLRSYANKRVRCGEDWAKYEHQNQAGESIQFYYNSKSGYCHYGKPSEWDDAIAEEVAGLGKNYEESSHSLSSLNALTTSKLLAKDQKGQIRKSNRRTWSSVVTPRDRCLFEFNWVSGDIRKSLNVNAKRVNPLRRFLLQNTNTQLTGPRSLPGGTRHLWTILQGRSVETGKSSAEWKEFLDEQSREVFYASTDGKQWQWERPSCIVADETQPETFVVPLKTDGAKRNPSFSLSKNGGVMSPTGKKLFDLSGTF